MPRTEAQKRADKKYLSKKYKFFSVNAQIEEYDKIEKYCQDKNISRSSLAIKSIMYIIDNNIEIQQL